MALNSAPWATAPVLASTLFARAVASNSTGRVTDLEKHYDAKGSRQQWEDDLWSEEPASDGKHGDRFLPS